MVLSGRASPPDPLTVSWLLSVLWQKPRLYPPHLLTGLHHQAGTEFSEPDLIPRMQRSGSPQNMASCQDKPQEDSADMPVLCPFLPGLLQRWF